MQKKAVPKERQVLLSNSPKTKTKEHLLHRKTVPMVKMVNSSKTTKTTSMTMTQVSKTTTQSAKSTELETYNHTQVEHIWQNGNIYALTSFV